MNIHILEHVKWGILRNILSPSCRAYARLSMPGDEPADRIMRFLAGLSFWLVHSYIPNIKSPRSFSEKLFRRMLFDRNPLWRTITDKLLVRSYVKERIGGDILVPLLWTGEIPDAIPFDNLPAKFFIKTNHGCAYNMPVRDIRSISIQWIQRRLKRWLSENFCTDKNIGIEWAYKNIKPKILIESFLEDKGKPPDDYKFYCYSGTAEFLLVVKDRYGKRIKRFFSRDLKPLNIRRPLDIRIETDEYIKGIEFPDNYEEMVQAAESLAKDFDFIRVDLYNAGTRIYFGELTCYPAGGMARFIPRHYDFMFGEKWPVS